jgi:hypothetical protein
MLKTPPRAATYSAAAGLKKDEVEARILDVFKGFEKVDPAKVHQSSGYSPVVNFADRCCSTPDSSPRALVFSRI